MADSDNESGGHTHDKGAREQDRFLPIANVSRIMKKALPANAKISKDAKETVQECVSEFISFITGEASDKCQREKRKTINGDDLLWAMTTLGFEEYVEPLNAYLQKFREMEGEKESGGGGGGNNSNNNNNNNSSSSNKEGDNVVNVGNNWGGGYGGMMMYGSSPSSSSYDSSYQHQHQHHQHHQHHQMGGRGNFGSGGNPSSGGFGRRGRG